MKFALLLIAGCILVAQTRGSLILQKWIEVGSDPLNVDPWARLIIYQVLGFLGPILAGPVKAISLDLYDWVLKSDTTGLAPHVLEYYGIFAPEDFFMQVWDFALFQGFSILGWFDKDALPDMSTNLMNKLFTNPTFIEGCADDPSACGLNCKRIPDLEWNGNTCDVFCGPVSADRFANVCHIS